MSNFDNTPNDGRPFSSVDGEVKQVLASIRQDIFAPGFEDRALARWNRERITSSSTFTFIERRAWQLLPLAIAASLVLAMYSAQHNSTPNASLLARVLGWQSSVTVASLSQVETYESVYATLYGLPLVNATTGVQ